MNREARPKTPTIKMIVEKSSSASRILDLGCGSGATVAKLNAMGFDAYGTDLEFKTADVTDPLMDEGRLRLMNAETLELPFEGESFDLVFADQVIEHVEDLQVFAEEASRVLKSGGIFIGYYPSRFKLFEAHVKVPLAGIIRHPGWLRLWVALGVYRTSRTYDPVQAIADYLTEKTHYRRTDEVRSVFSKVFSDVKFEPELLLRSLDNPLARTLVFFPLVPHIFNATWSTLLVARK